MGARKKEEARPRRIKLPIRMNGEMGLGDVLSRVTSVVGIKPCGRCKERAKKLNQKLVVSGISENSGTE